MLADDIEFSFPSNYSAARVTTATFKNHKEDQTYAHHFTNYVETEL